MSSNVHDLEAARQKKLSEQVKVEELDSHLSEVDDDFFYNLAEDMSEVFPSGALMVILSEEGEVSVVSSLDDPEQVLKALVEATELVKN